jgi:hypothetical protein
MFKYFQEIQAFKVKGVNLFCVEVLLFCVFWFDCELDFGLGVCA